MTTYYEYLRGRLLAASAGDLAQVEHLVHTERNALWQRIVADPAYDEQIRLQTLAVFDEAASRVLFEQQARFERRPAAGPALDSGRREEPSGDGRRGGLRLPRPSLRDLIFLIVGVVLGLAAGVLIKGGSATPAGTRADNGLGIIGLTAPDRPFRFVKGNASPIEGELTVDYAPGAEAQSYACEVEATYRQLLEYVKFEDSCRKISFRFLPLEELWKSFNYVEGYMVFSATIMSSAGARWEGSASVYFAVNGETS